MTNRASLTNIFLICAAFIGSQTVHSQGTVPPEANAVKGMELKAAQDQLMAEGYEIASSSLTAKKQYWWSERTKACVCLKFDKSKVISEVTGLPANECEEGVARSRKVWESYHDGASPAKGAKLDSERATLQGSGFAVSYWVNEASPGRSTEFWHNASTGACKGLVYETATGNWVKTYDKTGTDCANPAPKRE